MTEPNPQPTNNAVISVKKSTAAKYIPIEDLIQASIDNPNLTDSDVAKLFGITNSVVSRRFKQAGYVRQRLQNYKKNKADIFDFICSKIVNSVTPTDIKKAGLLQRSTSFGIFFDKMRLERGQFTVNVGITAQDIAKQRSIEQEQIEDDQERAKIQLLLKDMPEEVVVSPETVDNSPSNK